MKAAGAVAGLGLCAGGRGQAFTVVYSLGSNPGDPTYPREIGLVAEGPDGCLYTTSQQGGASGHGTVFKVTTGGKLTVLRSLDGVHDGSGAQGGVTLGADGCFYGTSWGGGAHGAGTIWKVTSAGQFTVLHVFDYNDGAFPISAPVQGKDGNFYGVTTSSPYSGFGVIYRISPSGMFAPLFTFTSKTTASVGALSCGLIAASDGNFYGTNIKGGLGFGTVYRVTPTGAVSAVHVFDNTHGALAYNLLQASDGSLYGTCSAGGPSTFGLVFKLTLAGQYTVLHNFSGADGATPVAGVVQAKDGYLWGATKFGGIGNRGVIFRMKPDGTGFAVIHTRKGDMSEGLYCVQTPIQHSDGNIYGDVYEGGAKGMGLVYKVDLSTVSFTPASGKVGAAVTLSGVGLTGATSVTIGGLSAAFKVISDTSISVTVPSGATTGVLKVVTPLRTLTSTVDFVVSS